MRRKLFGRGESFNTKSAVSVTTYIAMLLCPNLAYADGLAEVWERDPIYAISSDRDIGSLELCIALAISDRTLPSSVRGKDRVLISTFLRGAPDRIAQSVRVIDLGATRRIEVGAVKAYIKETDEVKADVDGCVTGT